jgi:hypothetical protein
MQMANQSDGIELASLGEVLNAFTTLQCAVPRRRTVESLGGRLPWQREARHQAAGNRPSTGLRHTLPLTAAPPELPQAKPRRAYGRCTCGHCPMCLDNLRWERIFRERFASPDYYKQGIRIRYASPLSGC